MGEPWIAVSEAGRQLEETLEVLRDADTMRRLAASDEELARGETVTQTELAEAMRRRPTGE